jgi:regulator of replication initiation timing
MNDSREAQGLANNERPLLNSAESHAAQIRIDSLLHENIMLRSDKDVLTRRLNAKVAYENRAAQAFAENKRLLSDIEALTSKLNAKVAHENRAAQAVAENTRLLGDIKALTIENSFYRSSQAYANPGYGSIAAPLMAENRRLSSENEALKHRSTELMMKLHAKIGEERKS